VDITTGKIKWTYFAGDVINSSPTVVDGIVYFTGGLSSVYAVDAAYRLIRMELL
jgi:outer membrane protein assembly factor BamB